MKDSIRLIFGLDFSGLTGGQVAGGIGAKFFFMPRPGLFQFRDFVRVFRGEIVRLGTVVAHIIKFKGLFVVGDEFPIANADGAVAVMEPPEIVVAYGPVASEYRHKTLAG